MKTESKETETTKERITVLEKGIAAIEGPVPAGFWKCCTATLFPLKFW